MRTVTVALMRKSLLFCEKEALSREVQALI
jgi:hypothetical protein